MSVDRKTLDKIAHLSRLEIDESKKDKILEDMNKLVAFVDRLKEVDTMGVEPLVNMSSEINVVREDQVSGEITPETAVQNGPVTNGNWFKVPKVIK
ncbi:MAG: Asp-tRNA(Asn)/Glu-tRNA(Gln) amidotransferase subunit GatC [Cyclobacteriaceae bacterium]|jgi:aspartyl-tRNA(Asn)/glutamyl-tRNA(Gln) amidotransferase subunit C